MSKITFYVGLNIQDLKFQCGGGPASVKEGVVRYAIGETHRHLIEAGLHPRKIVEKVVREINYCADNWDLHISTHSDIPIHIVGLMIHECLIRACEVKVIQLSDDNTTVVSESEFNVDADLVKFPTDFWQFDYIEAKRLVSLPGTLVGH